MKYTAVLIDDEPNVRKTLRTMLEQNCPQITVCGEASTVAESINLIENTNPQIVLLDIQLINGSGFDILQHFEPVPFKFIFITAYDQYAIKAFKFSALDYLLKPLDIDELTGAIERVIENLQTEWQEEQFKLLLENFKHTNTELKKIILKTAKSIHLVSVKDIVRLEADKGYTTFYMVKQSPIVVSHNLKEYEELLEEYGFYRPHNSHLVNLQHIVRFDKEEGGLLVMSDDSEVPVSYRKREVIFSLFSQL